MYIYIHTLIYIRIFFVAGELLCRVGELGGNNMQLPVCGGLNVLVYI